MGNTDQAGAAPAGKKESSTDMVFRAIAEAREFGRVATRQTIQEATGLALVIVDDRVKYLKNVGRIQLVGGVAGVFEPTEDRAEDRAVSATILPNGRVKVEIGDQVLELTQREARHTGGLLAGLALQFRGA